MTPYVSGLALGLALILPIGAQNVFVLNQSLRTGMPRAMVAVVTAGVCDTALILVGAGGASALLHSVPAVTDALIVGGAAFLVFLGVRSLRMRPAALEPLAELEDRPAAIVSKAVGVSFLNPHAILDTVGVIGAAVAARAASERLAFAAGAVSASWLWFLLLGGAASLLHARLTDRVRLGLERLSGLILLVFAALLLRQLVSS